MCFPASLPAAGWQLGAFLKKGFASGRKYLNSPNGSTSTDRPCPSPTHLHTWPLWHPVVMNLMISCPRSVSKAGLA